MSALTFILVHGAWHDGSCWDQLAFLLRKDGHTVLAPDLPGHGANTLDLSKVSLKRYVQAIEELVREQAAPVVLVGHSMAGMVVTEVACRLPERIQALVYLCAYLPRSGESVFDLSVLNRGHEPMSAMELAMHLSPDKRSCTIDPASIVPLFYNRATSEIAREAAGRVRMQATLPLSSASHMDQDVFETLPSCYICCTDDRVIPRHHQHRMLARQPCRTLLQIDADHSPFLSCPEQLAVAVSGGVACGFPP